MATPPRIALEPWTDDDLDLLGQATRSEEDELMWV
jgi:hypothetical protein